MCVYKRVYACVSVSVYVCVCRSVNNTSLAGMRIHLSIIAVGRILGVGCCVGQWRVCGVCKVTRDTLRYTSIYIYICTFYIYIYMCTFYIYIYIFMYYRGLRLDDVV